MKDFLGYGRSRSSTDSNVLTRHFNPYVNCLHSQVGTARENMEVLIAEFDMGEIKYIGKMSSSQNSRVIDPEGISYAVTNGHKDGEPKIIEVRAIGRERTEEEKKRRHLYGDTGAKFSGGKQMCFFSEISGCLTTSPTKDNLVGEIYDVNCNKENKMNNDTFTSV